MSIIITLILNCNYLFHFLPELSPVQQQLSDINNRYQLLGAKLTDRQTELDSLREELRKHLDSLRALHAFLDKVRMYFRHLIFKIVDMHSGDFHNSLSGHLVFYEHNYKRISISFQCMTLQQTSICTYVFLYKKLLSVRSNF